MTTLRHTPPTKPRDADTLRERLADNWLDAILLDYVNKSFNVVTATECRDRILAAIQQADEAAELRSLLDVSVQRSYENEARADTAERERDSYIAWKDEATRQRNAAEALLHEAMRFIDSVDGCHGCASNTYEDEYTSLRARYDAHYTEPIVVGHVPPFDTVKDEGRRP